MSDKSRQKRKLRNRRHFRVRTKVSGSPQRPRLAVFRSNRHIVAQVIDDRAGATLAAASSLEADVRASGNGAGCEAAARVGTLVAERARSAGVESVVFDRGGYRYHGRVAALADAAREAGLEF
jgi:large subunit ribosomal protein L18